MGAHSSTTRRLRHGGADGTGAIAGQPPAISAGSPATERPGRRQRRTTVAAAAVLGALLSVSAVWMNSYAAFTSQTTNAGNNWTAGTVNLTDNDSDVAMFTATGLVPGATASNCITVSYNGNVGARVRLFESPDHAYSQTNGLGAVLDFVIEEGILGTPGNCGTFSADIAPAAPYSGTADNFASTKTNHGNGFGVWNPAGVATKTFKITYTLNAAATDAVQGGTASLAFRWESQST